MRILIIQPKLEKAIQQLENEMHHNHTVDIVIFPEGYLNENIEQACRLAKYYQIILIGGYRKLNDSPKDRAIIIDRTGEIILDRIKYSSTSSAQVEGLQIGHILCDELVVQGIKQENVQPFDLVVHPIGVGMFSEEQFQEWIDEAQKIAVTYNTIIIGTSHADGTFKNSNLSIPIAYCFNNRGEAVFIAKNDVRSIILDIQSTKVALVD